jgi:hypothetical protein
MVHAVQLLITLLVCLILKALYHTFMWLCFPPAPEVYKEEEWEDVYYEGEEDDEVWKHESDDDPLDWKIRKCTAAFKKMMMQRK